MKNKIWTESWPCLFNKGLSKINFIYIQHCNRRIAFICVFKPQFKKCIRYQCVTYSERSAGLQHRQNLGKQEIRTTASFYVLNFMSLELYPKFRVDWAVSIAVLYTLFLHGTLIFVLKIYSHVVARYGI